MSAQLSPGSGAVPRGSEVDHETPDEFVVRCTTCGRIGRKDGRRRLVDVLQDRVACSTDGRRDTQWRTIGYLERLAPPDDADRSPLLADGGSEQSDGDVHRAR